ncbi:MAG: hypothetical protein KDD66_18250 [Bdellovibrionales bacterium]|nr:hypothetical protein [Bdellovibrionales bacterium]
MRSNSEDNNRRPPRRATLLNFDWILERLSRQREIKNRLAENQYDVDSKNVACALLSKDSSKRQN